MEPATSHSNEEVRKAEKSLVPHYYRYLVDGKLSEVQQRKVKERLTVEPILDSAVKRHKGSEVPISVPEVAGSLPASSDGFFAPDAYLHFGLRILYLCRCHQLDIQPDVTVTPQLPPYAGEEGCRSVTSLNFEESYLCSRKALAAIVSVLPFCIELRVVSFSGSSIRAAATDGAHVIQLFRALTPCVELEVLDLTRNDIDDYFSSTLMQFIHSHPRLHLVRLEKSGFCRLVQQKVNRVLSERGEQPCIKELDLTPH